MNATLLAYAAALLRAACITLHRRAPGPSGGAGRHGVRAAPDIAPGHLWGAIEPEPAAILKRFLAGSGRSPPVGVPEGQDAGGAEADLSADALDETGFRGAARFLVMSFGGEAIYLATARLLIQPAPRADPDGGGRSSPPFARPQRGPKGTETQAGKIRPTSAFALSCFAAKRCFAE